MGQWPERIHGSELGGLAAAGAGRAEARWRVRGLTAEAIMLGAWGKRRMRVRSQSGSGGKAARRRGTAGRPWWNGIEALEGRQLFSAGDLDPTYGAAGAVGVTFPGATFTVADLDVRNGKA